MAIDDFLFKTRDQVHDHVVALLRRFLGTDGHAVYVTWALHGRRNLCIQLAEGAEWRRAALRHQLFHEGIGVGWALPGMVIHSPLRGPRRLHGHVQATAPVVFLDFDGVVAQVIYRPRLVDESEEQWVRRQASAHERIDPAAVARLNRLVDAIPAVRFVVSSSWRTPTKEGKVLHPPARLAEYLHHHGFRGTVIDVTPHLPSLERWDEIQAWLDAQAVPPTAFAILDDWNMGPLRARHVQTDYDTRLTDADVDRAMALLQPGPQKGGPCDRDAIPHERQWIRADVSMESAAP